MTEKQKDDLLKMQKELGIIEMTEYNPTENETVPNGKIVECNGNQYDILDELTEKEKAEYVSVQNAYNILKIRKSVKFFVVLAVLGIVAGIILGIVSIL